MSQTEGRPRSQGKGQSLARRLVPCLYPIKVLKVNIGKNMAAAQPGSGVIHEPRSVTSDLQARMRAARMCAAPLSACTCNAPMNDLLLP